MSPQRKGRSTSKDTRAQYPLLYSAQQAAHRSRNQQTSSLPWALSRRNRWSEDIWIALHSLLRGERLPVPPLGRKDDLVGYSFRHWPAGDSWSSKGYPRPQHVKEALWFWTAFGESAAGEAEIPCVRAHPRISRDVQEVGYNLRQCSHEPYKDFRLIRNTYYSFILYLLSNSTVQHHFINICSIFGLLSCADEQALPVRQKRSV